MMMLAQPSAPIIYVVVYSKNITNRWCAQEIFTSFFNTLTSLQGQSPVHILKQQFEALFVSIFLNPNSMSNPNQMTELFYKLIVYTRDIKALGHYTHGYMLVVELFKFGNKYETQVNKDTIQNNAFLLFESFVKNYGSWKDVKYFLNYYVEELHKAKSPNLSNDFFINKIIKMVCKQIKENSKSKKSNKSKS